MSASASVTPEKDFAYHQVMARGALVLNPRLPRSFGTATFYTASNKSITNVHCTTSPHGHRVWQQRLLKHKWGLGVEGEDGMRIFIPDWAFLWEAAVVPCCFRHRLL